MSHKHEESGFTIVELIITLFVAVAFLVSGYQLYNVIIKDGGQARAQSRASNVAYDYMRRYSASAAFPCTPSTPLNNSSITVSGLSAVAVTVAITCPQPSLTSLSEVSVTVTYNNPVQTMVYSTYVKR